MHLKGGRIMPPPDERLENAHKPQQQKKKNKMNFFLCLPRPKLKRSLDIYVQISAFSKQTIRAFSRKFLATKKATNIPKLFG
jgi:hypothetical protein